MSKIRSANGVGSLLTNRRALLAVFAVSVLVRVASALYQGPTIQPLPGVTDQISYHELALRVLDGHGFSFATGWWPATRANHPTAHWSYLYVLFLAAVYWVFGPQPLAARLLQAVLVGILHPLLAWRIGRRLFGPVVGLTAAACTALYGYFAYYGGALVTESLYFVAVLWVLDLATSLAVSPSALRKEGFRSWALLGLAFAAAAMLRQLFLLMVPIVLFWIAWRLLRRDGSAGAVAVTRALVGRLAATMGVLLVCIAPWTIRNYRAFGEFVPLNTNAGYVFFWGNHPIHGTHFIPILPNGPHSYGSLLPDDLRRLNEAQLDRALLTRGVGFIKDDPGRYLKLSLSRATEYFKFWPSADSGRLSNWVRVSSFGLVLPFLLLGILITLAGRRVSGQRAAPGAGLLLLVAAAYSLVHLLSWTLVRYRLPVDAVLMPFAALSLVAALEWIRGLVPIPDVSLRNAEN